MNWLITGGCGFIGTRLVGRLAGDTEVGIRVLDNLTVGSPEDLAAVAAFTWGRPERPGPVRPGVELLEGDIRDESMARRAAAGADVIVHLAANTGVQPSIEDPRADCLVNVLGTLNFLEAARHEGVRRFVFASSGGTVIGDAQPPIDESMVPRPKAPYGASKSAGEGYLSAYHGTFGVETVALRFGNVYGPGSHHKSSVVANFIRRALRGEPLEIYGDGHQTRDFIFVEDLLDAILAAATVPGAGGEVYQIATAQETTVQEVADATLEALRRVGVTDVGVRRTAPLRGEIRRNYSDTSKAARQLGWSARTSLEAGLRSTVAWFLAAREERDGVDIQP